MQNFKRLFHGKEWNILNVYSIEKNKILSVYFIEETFIPEKNFRDLFYGKECNILNVYSIEKSKILGVYSVKKNAKFYAFTSHKMLFIP